MPPVAIVLGVVGEHENASSWNLTIGLSDAGLRRRQTKLIEEIARVWGRLRVPNPENPLDKQIAATGIIPDLAVVTQNTAHFAPTGVRVHNPFEAQEYRRGRLRAKDAKNSLHLLPCQLRSAKTS